MDNPVWFQALITIIAILCLGAVWHERSKERLSRRATFLIITLGPFSWVTQIWLLRHIDLSNETLVLCLFYCTLTALACFLGLILINQTKRIQGRDVAQAMIWGQLVFPLLLVSFLPSGSMTLLTLLGC